jgi:superfamily II DNA or RNA helicase
MSLAVELRDYQLEALAAVEEAEAAGTRRQLVALPTGTGKTVVFSELIARRGGRALILVHRDELVSQALDKLAVAGLEDVGVVKAERDEHGAQVVVASVQSLSRRARLERVSPDFRTVVVDEAHHVAADSYQRVLEHVEAGAPPPLVVGVTATPERSDGIPLEGFTVTYRRRLDEMIGAGYLADLRALQIRLRADFARLHIRAGDFIEAEAEAMLLDADAPAIAVRAYQAHAPGRRAIVFTPTVKVAGLMADAFREAGILAESIDGGTPIEQRRGILAQFHAGQIAVVANCAVLTEGFDEPAVDCLIIARPTRSRLLYMQMLGRSTRKHPGKDDALILDLVGATSRHDLMTAAEVLRMPERALAERGAVAVLAQRQADEEAAQRFRGELVAHAVPLFARRPLHWIRLEGGAFGLPIGNGELLCLLPEAGKWRAVAKSSRGERTLSGPLPLDYAQGCAEDYARRAGAGKLVDPAAPWRRYPASERQLELLRKYGLPITESMTKGEASDALAARFAGFVPR